MDLNTLEVRKRSRLRLGNLPEGPCTVIRYKVPCCIQLSFVSKTYPYLGVIFMTIFVDDSTCFAGGMPDASIAS